MASWLTLCGLVLFAYTLYRWYLFNALQAKLRNIPTVGGDGFLTSYITAWKGAFWTHELIQEGYRKYPGSIFKIPSLFSPTGWIILVSGDQLTEDIRRASPKHISFTHFARDLLQADLLFPLDTHTDPYHIDTVRVALTRGYGSHLIDIADEVKCTFHELIPPTSEWKSYPLHQTMVQTVCRTANRMFVGLPLCRDPGYLDLNGKMAVHSFATASFIQVLPLPTRGIAAKLLGIGPKTHRALRKYVGPIIQERLEKFDTLGKDWEDKPNDLITWLIEAAPERCRNVPDIVQRMIVINVASIHTTSMTTTNALFDLASHQEYVQPLREEVETTVAALGWTKEALARMVKLDSFLKESSRLHGVGAASLSRKVLEDLPLSNGIIVPAGCTLGVASYPVHRNEDIYEHPESFDGARFVPPPEAMENLDRLKSQLTSLDFNFLLFGHGRHACPGRFFAVSEIKALVGHILLNYDIKLPGGKTEAPPGKWFAGQYRPDDTAHLLFRERS
ncbi:cytochrome P450 [Coprinopsis sp. MPI-PUGE-AT-0042]|nr:cytochrome P450 [Coprinopsis sp. MPI-PUGE-AT-0042]